MASGRTAEVLVNLENGRLTGGPPGSTAATIGQLFDEGWAADDVEHDDVAGAAIGVAVSKPVAGHARWKSAVFATRDKGGLVLLGSSPGAPGPGLAELLSAGWWVQAISGSSTSLARASIHALVVRAPVPGASPCHSALLEVSGGTEDGKVVVVASSVPTFGGPTLNDWTADPANPWTLDPRTRSASMGPDRRWVALVRARP